VADTQANIKVSVDTSQATSALGALSKALGALSTIVVGGDLVRQFVQITGSAQEMTNKLIFATGSLENANKTFELLGNTAKATGSNLGGTVDLFQKLAMSSTLAGSSQQSLAYITEQFNKTLQISGASGAGAASALYQFAQAIQKGTLNGDEFRTITETNGYLLKVLEKQTGKTSTELRQMATDGRLSAEILARALIETNQISEDYGKTIRTIPQAFENLNTSVTTAIKNFSDFTGIGDLIVKVLELAANNIGVVIGAIAGLAIGIAALLIPLIPAATAMAVLTGGAAVLGAVALGAAIGLAADQAGMFQKKTEQANQSQAETQRLAKAGLVITHERTKQASDLDKTLAEQIGKMNAASAIDMKSNGVKNIGLEVERAVGIEKEKYKKTGEAMLPTLEKQLANAVRQKELAAEHLTTQKLLQDIASQTLIATEQDRGQREIINQLESYRLSVSQQTYNANKDNLTIKIQESIQAKALADINDQLRINQAELASLSIQDLDKRQIEFEIAKKRLELGKNFTAQMETQLRLALETANAVGVMTAKQEGQRLLGLKGTGETWGGSFTPKPQTQEARINMANEEIKQWSEVIRVNEEFSGKLTAVMVSMESAQAEDMKAWIEIKKNLTGQWYMASEKALLADNNREVLQTQAHNAAMLNLEIGISNAKMEVLNNELFKRQAIFDAELAMEQKIAAARLKQVGVTNDAVLKSVNDNITNVKMIQQGGVQGFQGVLGALDSIMGPMAATNRKAFEAHKALAITQAVISTYQAAAMAIAFPPGPPLSFIYVAGAIAAGFAQVAAIRAQQYTGKAAGGGVAGGMTHLVGENGPELFTPASSGNITPNHQLGGGSVTNVNFTILANDTTGFDELLTTRKNLITQIIRDASLERGVRGTV